MALRPADNDAFFREVDENLRQDRLARFARRWGRWIALGIALALALLAGFLLWQNHRRAEAGADAEALTAVLAESDAGSAKPTDPRLAALAQSPRDGYRALARLTQADLAARTDANAAANDYAAIAGDAALPQPVRDLATVRGTALRFDALPPQQVIDRMKPLAVAGAPWFGSAAELTALAYLRLNQPQQAGPLFARIVRDPSVPASLRGRAAGMATALGQTVTPAVTTALKE